MRHRHRSAHHRLDRLGLGDCRIQFACSVGYSRYGRYLNTHWDCHGSRWSAAFERLYCRGDSLDQRKKERAAEQQSREKIVQSIQTIIQNGSQDERALALVDALPRFPQMEIPSENLNQLVKQLQLPPAHQHAFNDVIAKVPEYDLTTVNFINGQTILFSVVIQPERGQYPGQSPKLHVLLGRPNGAQPLIASSQTDQFLLTDSAMVQSDQTVMEINQYKKPTIIKTTITNPSIVRKIFCGVKNLLQGFWNNLNDQEQSTLTII